MADADQIGVDIKTALAEIEMMKAPPPDRPEHVFLALDKNVSGFPWESIPVLRGRPISRIPSLPFLLDQVDLARRLQVKPPTTAADKLPAGQRTDLLAKMSKLSINPDHPSSDNDLHRIVNSRKVFYILNPSGDLSTTQTHFEPWIKQMTKQAGWKGIIGRSPTDLEMVAALKDYDLVLYFGHGGAELYIASYKIKRLPKCATTMLWGCSSGALRDQGDFDRTGTAHNYVLAGWYVLSPPCAMCHTVAQLGAGNTG